MVFVVVPVDIVLIFEFEQLDPRKWAAGWLFYIASDSFTHSYIRSLVQTSPLRESNRHRIKRDADTCKDLFGNVLLRVIVVLFAPHFKYLGNECE